MSQETWEAVDVYIAQQLFPADPALDGALAAGIEAGLPPINVSAPQGRLLFLLAQFVGARRILELGTLAGYSSILMARALPPGGKLITLELDEKHAGVARANFARAGLEKVIELRRGRALDLLPKLATEGLGPFDLIFIDADKPNIPEYFSWALRLSRPGTAIFVDNVVRDGELANAASTDPSILGVRRFHEALRRTPGVTATTIQTVGGKGYDGFTLVRVNEAVS
jgi:predicted O-methyltransferase YrrM